MRNNDLYLERMERILSGKPKEYVGWLINDFLELDWDESKTCGDCPRFFWDSDQREGVCTYIKRALSDYTPVISEYRPIWCPMHLMPKE